MSFKNLDELIKYEFPEKNIVKTLTDKEIKNIDKKYHYSLSFFFKREIILIIDKIINFFLKGNFSMIKSRTLSYVKKKYDDLAGSYIEEFNNEDRSSIIELSDNRVVEIKGDIKDYHSECLSKIIIETNSKKILDVGTGEFTQFYLVKNKLNNKNYELLKDAGLDISFNRLDLGKKFLNQNNIKIDYILQADASNIPISENSFDLIYTCHCLEQVPNLFQKSVEEMLRVSSKFVVLIEPSYELSSAASKKYIYGKNYVMITDKILSKIKGVSKILRKKLPVRQYINGAEMIIIEKNTTPQTVNNDIKFISPKSKDLLILNEEEKTFETKNKKEKFLIDKGIIRFLE